MDSAGSSGSGAWTTAAPEVDAWFDTYENPQEELVLAVREVLLDTDVRLGEAMKWKAATFVYRGNLASFLPRSTQHVTLMSHTGASPRSPWDPGG